MRRSAGAGAWSARTKLRSSRSRRTSVSSAKVTVIGSDRPHPEENLQLQDVYSFTGDGSVMERPRRGKSMISHLEANVEL